MEQEAREKAHGSTNCLLNPSQTVQAENNVQTLDTMHALCLPLGASISLLVMFFFFDSMQMLFAICTASKYCLFFILFICTVITSKYFKWHEKMEPKKANQLAK